jgi:hypothetical protein
MWYDRNEWRQEQWDVRNIDDERPATVDSKQAAQRIATTQEGEGVNGSGEARRTYGTHG